MGKVGQKVVMLLDADKVLSNEELVLAAQSKAAAKEKEHEDVQRDAA